LIEDHMDDILNLPCGLFDIIDKKQYGTASLLYALFKQVPIGLKRLQQEVEKYVVEKCWAIMNPLVGTRVEDLLREQALAVIRRVIEVKNATEKMGEVSFEMNSCILSGVKKQLSLVINTDKLVMARFLTLFVDELASDRGRTMQESEIDVIVKDVTDLCYLLRSKDVFEKYYRRDLKTRLLNSMKLENVDTETQLIEKLKGSCSKELVGSALGMIEEIKKADGVSKDFSSQYRGSLPFDLGVILLTKNKTWDFRCPTLPWTNLPGRIRQCFEFFSARFYVEKFDKVRHRKLLILPGYGNATINHRFRGGIVQLVTSSVQMMILELFNRQPKISVQNMVATLGVPEQDVFSAIKLLGKRCPGLIRREKTDAGKQTPLSKNDVLFVNPGFNQQNLAWCVSRFITQTRLLHQIKTKRRLRKPVLLKFKLR